MSFAEPKKLKQSYLLAWWCALLLLLQSVLLLFSQDDFHLKTNLILQLVALAGFALFSKKASQTYLNAPLVFAGSIFIWHSTFLLGYYFDLAPIFEFPGDTFDIGFDHIYKSTALVGLCLSLALFGMLWGYRREKRDAHANLSHLSAMREGYSVLGAAAKRTALYLFGGMTAILLVFMVHEGRDLFSRTYLEFYDQQNLSLIALLFYRSEYLWAFVIILAIAAYRDSVRIRAGLAVAIVGIAVLLAMLGPRTGPFMCLTTLLLSWDAFVQRVKLRWIGAFVIFLAAASYVIASGRDKGIGVRVFQFSDTGREKLELLDLFSEQGKSIAVVLRTIEFTQRNGLVYGRTFLDGIVSTLPLPLLHVVGYNFGPSLTEFVVDNSPNSIVYSGPGSSVVAELYYNFGTFGCLGFVAIGWFVARSYFKFRCTGDIFAALIAFTVAGMYTVMMRNDLSSAFRLIVYAYIMISIMRKKREAPTQARSKPPVAPWHREPMLLDGEA